MILDLVWKSYRYCEKNNSVLPVFLYYDFVTGEFLLRDSLVSKPAKLYEFVNSDSFRAKFMMTAGIIFSHKWTNKPCKGVEIKRCGTVKTYLGLYDDKFYIVVCLPIKVGNIMPFDNSFSFDMLNIGNSETSVGLEINCTLAQILVSNSMLLDFLLQMIKYKAVFTSSVYDIHELSPLGGFL